MPFTSVLILIGIVAAFAVFGLTLAWGEIQTRNLVRSDEAKADGADKRNDYKRAA